MSLTERESSVPTGTIKRLGRIFSTVKRDTKNQTDWFRVCLVVLLRCSNSARALRFSQAANWSKLKVLLLALPKYLDSAFYRVLTLLESAVYMKR